MRPIGRGHLCGSRYGYTDTANVSAAKVLIFSFRYKTTSGFPCYVIDGTFIFLRFSRGLLAFAALLLTATPAWPHLLPAQQGTVNVLGNYAFIALSVPVSAFPQYDDDGDHFLSIDELTRHQAALKQEIDRRLQVFSGADHGKTVTLDLMLSIPDDQGGSKAEQVLVLKHVVFSAAPKTLGWETDLFGTGPADQRLMITATRGSEKEAAQLTPERPGFEFFRPAWRALLDYVTVGAEHILLGTDHLLFLLTIWVAGAGWRYWLTVVSSFTVAHSITLCLATLGLVHASPNWVEPMIAASIVIMALDGLWCARRKIARPTWQRAALVFGCGLLHGLGFASVMTNLGLDIKHLVLSLVGFNLGIELGQAIFLVGLGSAMVVLRHLLSPAQETRFTQLLSLSAAGVGSFWLIQRLA